MMTDELTVSAAAAVLAVSETTLRNWIKCGNLRTNGQNNITEESFDNFRQHIVTTRKLTSRANKSLLDKHDHKQLTRDVFDKLNAEDCHSGALVAFYERSLSSAYKNKEGIYYTPISIARDFFSSVQAPLTKQTFCDPACGTGNFLVAALQAGFKPANIYGYDVDEVAVAIAQKRLFELTGQHVNIACKDFLTLTRAERPSCDVIFTNPPWGKKLPKQRKLALNARFQTGSCGDSAAWFMNGAIEMVKDNGMVGMLLPAAFFNIATFANIRAKVFKYKIVALKEYGKVFKGLMTSAQGLSLQKTASNKNNAITCTVSAKSHAIKQTAFCKNPNIIFNFKATQQEHDVLAHVRNRAHITLKGRARWALGIVTGNNKAFIKNKPAAGYMPVLKGADLCAGSLKKPTSFIPNNLKLYQQAAPLELYEAQHKLIYKFISSKLSFYYDNKKYKILNSANLLILNEDFPLSYEMTVIYLNSKFVNWFHHCIFNTFKILRSSIETIPIFVDYLSNVKKFDELELYEFIGIETTAGGAFKVKS